MALVVAAFVIGLMSLFVGGTLAVEHFVARRSLPRYDPALVAAMEKELTLSIEQLAEQRQQVPEGMRALVNGFTQLGLSMEQTSVALAGNITGEHHSLAKVARVVAMNQQIERQMQPPVMKEIKPGYAYRTAMYHAYWVEIDEKKLVMLVLGMQGRVAWPHGEFEVYTDEARRRSELGWEPPRRKTKPPTIAPHEGATLYK